MPKFNLELFKTLVLSFAYIHSKSRKLGMFILFQKCQFVYPNKINSPPFRGGVKWEMLAATNARWKGAAVKKNEREYVWHFLHKTCN